MQDNETALRQQLIDTMQAMAESGLNHGTAGNASVRCGDAVLITPSGIPAAALTADSIVKLTGDGQFHGDYKPSSEWRMHSGLLAARADIRAVVHCHSRYATTLACAHKTIPPLHYMTAVTGGAEVRLAPYATFGSQALADHIVTTLDGRFGCLMANHGQIALGGDLAEALMIAGEIETQAAYYHGALAIGGAVELDTKQMSAVLKAFGTYGQNESSD